MNNDVDSYVFFIHIHMKKLYGKMRCIYDSCSICNNFKAPSCLKIYTMNFILLLFTFKGCHMLSKLRTEVFPKPLN